VQPFPQQLLLFPGAQKEDAGEVKQQNKTSPATITLLFLLTLARTWFCCLSLEAICFCFS